MKILKIGQVYRTKSAMDFHGSAQLTITSIINGKSNDGFVEMEAYPKIRYKRDYNLFTARVWWVKECCVRIR